MLFEFFIEFWTFSLRTELILLPITVVFSFLYALASKEKKYKSAKSFFEVLLAIWASILIVHALYNTICYPEKFFNWDSLKELTLPVILLILNLPVVYGLALYSGYEQLFIKIKTGAKGKGKMKLHILKFAGISLPRVSAIRRHLHRTLHISMNADGLRSNLKWLDKHLSMQIGENYMKRANFYIISCLISAIASIFGLVLANSAVPLKDIITLNFVLDIPRIKEIFTYILSVSLVFSIALLLCAIGFRMKKNEEISQIKKYAIFEFLFSLKRQKEQLQDYPPIDDPISLFVNYMQIARELQEACTKALEVYGNLLTTWEQESIDSLRTSAVALLTNVATSGRELPDHDIASFCEFYNEKVKASQYNEKFNSFTSILTRDAQKYAQRVEISYEDFKQYYT